MGITTENILEVFEQMGLRSTRQRRLIAERLAQRAAAGSYFATDDFWHELQQDDAGLGRATVYRAVEVLAQEGVLDRVEFADGTHRYRVCGKQSHHHHVTCTQCHRVVNVEACLSSELLSAIERQTQFILKGHSLELFGQCPQCRQATDTSEKTTAR